MAFALCACGAAGGGVGEISSTELKGLMAGVSAPLVLDVRSSEEYASGHVPGALNIPHDQVGARLAELDGYRDRGVVTYCQRGGRAGVANGVLAEAGFSNVMHLAGDMPGWFMSGFDVSSSPDASVEESVRPGINDRFLAKDLDVDEFVNVFEGESREIFRGSPEIVRRLGIKSGMAVADIGAGTGLFLPLFVAESGDAGKVYAVEIAPNFIAHLERRKDREGLETVSVVEGKERSVELGAASIDLAFVCDTYHHFEYPKSTLASLKRAIRPGGSLIIIDFERNEGTSSEWVMEHVRAGKEVFRAEIEAAGFEFVEEIAIDKLEENYVLRFRRI